MIVIAEASLESTERLFLIYVMSNIIVVKYS